MKKTKKLLVIPTLPFLFDAPTQGVEPVRISGSKLLLKNRGMIES